MSAPTIDELNGSGVYTPDGNDPDDVSLKFIDADIGEFLSRPKTAIAREYERKTQSALNAVMRFCVQKPSTVPDAAAIIAYGDGFASAVGEVAEINARTRKMIDLILAPESPYLALAIAGIPLITQLMRNHESALSAMPGKFKPVNKAERKARKEARKATAPKLTLKIFRREIGIRIPFKLKLGFLFSQTADPEALTDAVFSNEHVLKALKKRGIDVNR